jgi:hypothetical protein
VLTATTRPSDGLWGVLAGAMLGLGDHATGPEASSFWLNGLAAAGEMCGTLDAWHDACSSVNPERRRAYLTKVISDYEKLFLLDARSSAVVANTSMSCKPSIDVAYKTLAALWIAYAAILVLGLGGLMVYWCLCDCRSRRGTRRRPAATAYNHVSATGLSAQGQRPAGVPQQRAGAILSKLWRGWLWLLPRIRAVGFVVDVGLDVYTLVMLVHSRWFGQLLGAILVPYGLMAMLVGPGIIKEDRSSYGVGICYRTSNAPGVASVLHRHPPTYFGRQIGSNLFREIGGAVLPAGLLLPRCCTFLAAVWYWGAAVLCVTA